MNDKLLKNKNIKWEREKVDRELRWFTNNKPYVYSKGCRRSKCVYSFPWCMCLWVCVRVSVCRRKSVISFLSSRFGHDMRVTLMTCVIIVSNRKCMKLGRHILMTVTDFDFLEDLLIDKYSRLRNFYVKHTFFKKRS